MLAKIKKELKEVCLVDQPFVKDSDLSVGQYVEKCAKEIGKDMKVVSMVRFEVGEESRRRKMTLLLKLLQRFRANLYS